MTIDTSVKRLECNCENEACSVRFKCRFLPTEYYLSTKGTVDILFVGQGGGSFERKRGRPFIGPAGKRLRELILYVRRALNEHIGVALSNTIRDCPDQNRVPNNNELDWCLPHLYQDIVKLKEMGLKVIMPLGNVSKHALVPGCNPSISVDRGSVYYITHETFGKMPFIPTYHPSYLVRTSSIHFNPKSPSKYEMLVIEDIIKAYKLEIPT